MGGNNEFFEILKETNFWKNYPACKELTNQFDANEMLNHSPTHQDPRQLWSSSLQSANFLELM